MTSNETIQHNISEVADTEDLEIPQEFVNVKETHISVHLSKEEKEEYIQFLKNHPDVFTWSYADMTGLSTSIVAHRLPTEPSYSPIK